MAYRGRYSDPEKYLWGEKERRDEQIRNLLNMFMMSKQLGEERGGEEWKRGFEETEQARRFEHLGAQERLWETQAEKAGRPPIAKEPSEPDWMKKANEMVRVGIAENLGDAYNKLFKLTPKLAKEPGISKSREDFLNSLEKDIKSNIKNLMDMKEFGLMEDPVNQVTNLQRALTRIRGARLAGADRPLSKNEWEEIGRISTNLEKIKEEGLYPPEKKPLIKAKMPKIKRVDLLPGTQVKWNPEYRIKMAKIDGVWHWVLD